MINRRDFLKGIAMTLDSGIIIPETVSVLFPNSSVKKNFLITPLAATDFISKIGRVRYDIMVKGERIFVANNVEDIYVSKEEYIETIHEPMVEKLKEYIGLHKIKCSDIAPVEIPLSYEEPWWFSDIIRG